MRKLSLVFLVLTLAIVTSSVYASPTAYVFTGSQEWGTMNLTTGVFTSLGNAGIQVTGLGTAGGNVYGELWKGGTLYQINVTNGSLTKIGSDSVDFNGLGSTPTGLYGYDGSNQNLYSINPSTGAATLLGSTGIALGTCDGMSVGPGGLYLAMDYGAGSLLYLLNTTNGSATLVGDTGVPGIGAMVWIGGVLYAGNDFGTLSVWTLNTTTGLGTLVANTSGMPDNFWGLAPVPTPVPEPSSLLCLGSGLTGVVAATRRKLRRK